MTAFANAQTDGVCLGFEDALQIAAQADPAVATSEARRREAKADVEEARSLFRPQISAFARTGIGDVGLIDSAIQNQIGLSASQRIIDFGDARLARRAARHSVDASEQEIRLAEQRAGFSAGSAIIDILQAREAIAFTAERRAYFENQLAAIESVLGIGGSTLSERAEISAQVANAKAFTLDLESQLERAETTLSIELAGAPALCSPHIVETGFSLLGKDLTTIDLAVDRALQDAPELKSLRARADSLSAQSERERRARLPIVSVVGSAAYSSIGSNSTFEFQERVGVDVSVPLYTGNALAAQGRRATAREAAAKSEVAERRRELEEEVRISYRRALSLDAQVLTAQDVEDRNKELFEFAQVEYDAGTRTLPELVDVRIDYERSGLQRIQMKFDLMRERLRLLSLTGDLG
ncbi:MAG: TolC family protein [Pseudomonadota bacterium]